MANQIRTFGMSKMTVGSCSDFHSKVKTFIEDANPETLHINDKMEAYSASVDQLASIINRPRAFVATAEMKETDHQRDNASGVINSVVKSYLTTPVAAKSSAAQLLWPQLSPYKGIRNHEYTKQTAEVKGMLMVLNAAENKEAVTTLGLNEEVAALQTANTAFEAAFLSKAVEMSGRVAQSDISSKNAQSQVNALYQDIVQTVNAYAIVSPSDDITFFIEQVNGLVAAYSRISSTSSAKSPVPEGEMADGQGSGTRVEL